MIPVQVPRSPVFWEKTRAVKAKPVVASAILYQNSVELCEREYTLENTKAAMKNKAAVEAAAIFVAVLLICGMLDSIATAEKTIMNRTAAE